MPDTNIPSSTSAATRLLAPKSRAAHAHPSPRSSNAPSSAPAKDSKPTAKSVRKIKDPLAVMLAWTVPERIWKPKSNIWYLASAAVIMVLILGAVKLEYYIFVIALIAFLLLWFIQGAMEPEMLTHKITLSGIYTYNTLFRWEDIQFFWIAQNSGWKLLHLDFKPELRQPRITLLIADSELTDIFNLLLDKLKYGKTDEVGFNLLAQISYGQYLPISSLVPDLDKP